MPTQRLPHLRPPVVPAPRTEMSAGAGVPWGAGPGAEFGARLPAGFVAPRLVGPANRLPPWPLATMAVTLLLVLALLAAALL